MTDTMDDRSLRVIQVGIGGFGSSWAEIARKAEGVVLAAVVDPSPVARGWAHVTLGLSDDQVFTSLDDALSAVKCDAVLVITPPVTHHAVASQALLAGKHVLVEKPLAATMSEAEELIETAKRENRMLVVSQNYRFRSPARTVQRFVRDGELGPLLAVQMSCRRDTRRLWSADNFRYQMRHPYIVDMAIHHFDLIRALTGRNVARIDARSWRVPDSPFAFEPALAAVIDLAGDVPVTYEGDWATSGPETSWNGDWTFVGEHGRLLWTGGVGDAQKGHIRCIPQEGDPYEVDQDVLPSVDRLGSLQAFRHAVLTGEPAETRAEDNILSLAVVITCVDSVEMHVPVALA